MTTHRGDGIDVRERETRQNPYRDVIAIDGPAGAGKSTVARAVAEEAGALLFDTGTLYRAVTLAVLRAGVPETDEAALTAIASSVHIDVVPPTMSDGRLYDVLLNGEDVTWEIRGKDVEARVSAVSAHPGVRQALMPVQRRIARLGRVVMVGRDVGTVVVPEAGLKIYLDASLEERARRRCRELEGRGQPAEFDAVLAAIQARDKIDSERATAPLRSAPDAIVLDTDGRSVPEVVAEVVALAREVYRAHKRLTVATGGRQ
ncbi:MAG TPA: (d)CMP kinase [Thermomicrobiales bacterium]|nr:(d)CMP kinase [Thermomicrobiales bacterium]